MLGMQEAAPQPLAYWVIASVAGKPVAQEQVTLLNGGESSVRSRLTSRLESQGVQGFTLSESAFAAI